MHLAILMTNTDESAFAQAHPKDGEAFTTLIQLVRPDWKTTVFSVKDGIFPTDLSDFDGALITGSPASVRSGEGWVLRLLDLIRDMHRLRQPVFGACFGHQAIAMALGGTIDWNPGGWVHGLTVNPVLSRPGWADDLPDQIRLYGCHSEQVSQLPEGAVNLTRSTEAATTGFAIGRHIYTTQHHPEMTKEFVIALTEEISATLGPDVCQRALASLAEPADQRVYAESIARFFEQAKQD